MFFPKLLPIWAVFIHFFTTCLADLELVPVHARDLGMAPTHDRRDDPAMGLDLQEYESFFWGGQGGDDIMFANLTLYFRDDFEFIIGLEHFETLVSDVTCGSSMVLKFTDAAAYTKATEIWNWVNDDTKYYFVFVLSAGRCGNEDRKPYIVNNMAFDEAGRTISLTAEGKEWVDVAKDYSFHMGYAPPIAVGAPAPNSTALAKRDTDFTMNLASNFNRNLFSQKVSGMDLSLDCSNCGTQGKILVDFDMDVSWSGPKVSMKVNPQDVAAFLGLTMKASGTLTRAWRWEKTLVSIPINGIKIGSWAKIGAFLDVDVGFSLDEWQGEVSSSFGAKMAISNSAVVQIDVFDPDNGKFSGWNPALTALPFALGAKVSGSAQIYAQPSISLSATALKHGIEMSLDLRMPYIEIDFDATVNTNGVCGTKKTAGVNLDASAGVDLSVQVAKAGNEANPLWEKTLFDKSWPLFSKCYPFGPEGNGDGTGGGGGGSPAKPKNPKPKPPKKTPAPKKPAKEAPAKDLKPKKPASKKPADKKKPASTKKPATTPPKKTTPPPAKTTTSKKEDKDGPTTTKRPATTTPPKSKSDDDAKSTKSSKKDDDDKKSTAPPKSKSDDDDKRSTKSPKSDDDSKSTKASSGKESSMTKGGSSSKDGSKTTSLDNDTRDRGKKTTSDARPTSSPGKAESSKAGSTSPDGRASSTGDRSPTKATSSGSKPSSADRSSRPTGSSAGDSSRGRPSSTASPTSLSTGSRSFTTSTTTASLESCPTSGCACKEDEEDSYPITFKKDSRPTKVQVQKRWGTKTLTFKCTTGLGPFTSSNAITERYPGHSDPHSGMGKWYEPVDYKDPTNILMSDAGPSKWPKDKFQTEHIYEANWFGAFMRSLTEDPHNWDCKDVNDVFYKKRPGTTSFWAKEVMLAMGDEHKQGLLAMLAPSNVNRRKNNIYDGINVLSRECQDIERLAVVGRAMKYMEHSAIGEAMNLTAVSIEAVLDKVSDDVATNFPHLLQPPKMVIWKDNFKLPRAPQSTANPADNPKTALSRAHRVWFRGFLNHAQTNFWDKFPGWARHAQTKLESVPDGPRKHKDWIDYLEKFEKPEDVEKVMPGLNILKYIEPPK